MVMRIEEMQSSTSPHLTLTGHDEPRSKPSRSFRRNGQTRIAHTGQDCTQRTNSVMASILLRERLVASRLEERRQLRGAQLRRTSEMTSAFSIDLDDQLLTGDLDQDITILDIVA